MADDASLKIILEDASPASSTPRTTGPAPAAPYPQAQAAPRQTQAGAGTGPGGTAHGRKSRPPRSSSHQGRPFFSRAHPFRGPRRNRQRTQAFLGKQFGLGYARPVQAVRAVAAKGLRGASLRGASGLATAGRAAGVIGAFVMALEKGVTLLNAVMRANLGVYMAETQSFGSNVIRRNETLKHQVEMEEARIKRMEQLGPTVGGVAGTVSGMAAGAAIGSAIAPGVGTVVGAGVGGTIGYFGGRAAGGLTTETIGLLQRQYNEENRRAAQWKDDYLARATEISRYSGPLAGAEARAQIAGIGRDTREAQALGPQYSRFLDADVRRKNEEAKLAGLQKLADLGFQKQDSDRRATETRQLAERLAQEMEKSIKAQAEAARKAAKNQADVNKINEEMNERLEAIKKLLEDPPDGSQNIIDLLDNVKVPDDADFMKWQQSITKRRQDQKFNIPALNGLR